jgi:hypothetical protein
MLEGQQASTIIYTGEDLNKVVDQHKVEVGPVLALDSTAPPPLKPEFCLQT